MSDSSILTANDHHSPSNIGLMRQLVKFLESEKAKGRSHVLLDEDARQVLRSLANSSKSAPKSNPTTSKAPATATSKPPSLTKDEAMNANAFGLTAISSSLPKSEQLAQLEQQVRAWPSGDFPQSLRQTMVFSSGNPESKVMLIGEAPGHEEEKALCPFVGPAGKKLDQILEAMGLKRDETYVTNIVKFRPATARQTTNNRKPTTEEVAAFIPVIREEIRIVAPQCIVALGATALEALLGTDSTVASERGRWHEFEGIPLRVTYHPSYLLQTGENLSVKRMLWEDMLAVMEKLGMEISTKQRGYFLPNP